jgi:hypothetical protein
MDNESEKPTEPAETEPAETERTETEARQGVTRQGVRWVLILGTAGALIALLIAGLLVT